MTLVTLHISVSDATPLPAAVQALLSHASECTDAFIESHKDNPAAGFVPSDYAQVYRGLKQLIVTSNLLPGCAFCEWGSGMGVITDLAAMCGMDAVGIEIDARLVAAATQLACQHRINAQFVQGSYVPDGFIPADDDDESHVMTLENGRAAYDELGLDPNDFDCIFAYPWPGEDDVVTAVFDRYAARGALLLTYHGQDGLIARRKVR